MQTPEKLHLDGTDIEISVTLDEDVLTIEVLKAGCSVHTLLLENVAERMEHAWLADCIREKQRVDLRAIESEAFDYLVRTNINQG